MSLGDRQIIIVGGGLAGLSAGCYALQSGYRTIILEHNASLGGVCTAWQRGPYTIDGCIHWLTGGPFSALYEELGILPQIQLRTIERWLTYRDARDGLEVPFTRDLADLVARLTDISPADAVELQRMRHAAQEFAEIEPPLDAPELIGLGHRVRSVWEMRRAASTLLHYHQPVSIWAEQHLKSPRLRRLFTRIVPETAPALFLLMVLGYLERGYLSRPVGGTAAFRDALQQNYFKLGGEARMRRTVEEVTLTGNHVTGVAMDDGTLVESSRVISTASAPETIRRLLGGRYEADVLEERLKHWKLFDPIVLASFCVDVAYEAMPQLMIIDHVEPVDTGGRETDSLYLRFLNDDPSFAPAGRCVVQAMLPSNYTWWATRGDHDAAKSSVERSILEGLERHLPDLRASLHLTDLATPLAFWNNTRSWRGAYEGWLPNAESMLNSLPQTVSGLKGFYMAGQWLSPGGGVPMALLSGRRAAQLICHHNRHDFVAHSAAPRALQA